MRRFAGLARTSGARTLGERLAAARQRAFVGRAAERSLFEAALDGRTAVCAVYLHGPGGIGKSALLAEFAALALRAGVSCVSVDGRSVDPSPAGLISALDATPAAVPKPAGDLRATGVILIDHYDELLALDRWVRTELFARLPLGTVLVLAARQAPDPGWRADAGLAELCRIVPLRNLTPDESREYFIRRGVPAAWHEKAIASTYGHPMALALLADVARQRRQAASADLTRHPDVVAALVERLLAGTPGPRHRAALEVCAHARVTTEALLADVLGGDDTRELFEGLRGLSCVERHEEGLVPHDVARDAFEADLRWRNPDRFRELHRTIRRHVLRRIYDSRGVAQQRAACDKIFIHRNSPLMKPYFDWSALGRMYVEAAGPGDHEAILTMVRRHEGNASARIAAHWLRRQPSAFQVYRDASGPPAGFMAHLLLESAGPQDMEDDPAISGIIDWLRRTAPLRKGERFLVHRFWMGRDRYQDAHTQSIIAEAAKLLWLNTPRLACAFPCTADAAHWTPMFAYINFERVPDADFVVGRRRYGVFAHDWRRERIAAWLDVLAERELDADLTSGRVPAAVPAPVLVLSEPDFVRAVRQALRDLADPAALAANPLTRSHLVLDDPRHSPPVTALQALLYEAVEGLKASRRDEKPYRALWHTYVRPAATQEAAAELLGLPFSTYRYHLARGLERVTARLWARELQGGTSAMPAAP